MAQVRLKKEVGISEGNAEKERNRPMQKKRKAVLLRLNEERGKITERKESQQQEGQVEYGFLNSPTFLMYRKYHSIAERSDEITSWCGWAFPCNGSCRTGT